MNYYILASLLLCFVDMASCMPVPAACLQACATRRDRRYTHECTSDMTYCTICREYFCPLTWWRNPFAEVGWNPHTVKTCDRFPSTIKTRCSNDNLVSSKCSLSCARGYMPSPDLYKGYGNTKWSYTHDEVMSFSVTCGYTTDDSVAWSRSEFSCVSKEEVLNTFFPVEPLKMMTKPASPYPDEYILKIFNGDMKDDIEDEEEASGDDSRSLIWYEYCARPCMWESGSYKFGCKEVGVYFCFACRLSRYCASSRSYAG